VGVSSETLVEDPLVPVSADDLELAPGLTDAQAERFWQELRREREEGRMAAFDSLEDAVDSLRRGVKGRRRSGRAAEKRLGRSRRR
jgi:hypothetical protein